MTAAEYLTARSWVANDKDGGTWLDSRHVGTPIANSPWFDGAIDTASALAIQRARDADDERKAWVAFAAASLASPMPRSNPGLAVWADDMLDAYRARFAVEVES